MRSQQLKVKHEADMAFTFVPNVHVIETHPQHGNTWGGTAVVSKVNFISYRASEFGYLRCRFGLRTVGATYVNASAMVCQTPALDHSSSTGRVPLEVSNNAQDFSSSGTLFEYVGEVRVANVFPSSGASSGGTLVQAEGEGFGSAGDEHRCSFGATAVRATFISSRLVRCLTPSQPVSRTVALEVSTNGGVDFSTSRVTFVFHPTVSVTTLTPQTGPTLGGTLLSVSGAHFIPSMSLKCRFGEIEVVGVFVSSSQLNCTAPPSHAGGANVDVSVNGVSFSVSGVTFTYQDSVSVLMLAPYAGPVAGGTNVSVIGTNLLPGSVCRFGEAPSSHSTWISSYEVTCSSPAHEHGSYALEVTNNVQDWTTSRVHFSFVSPVQVRAVRPVLGPEHGGTLVEVEGGPFALDS